MTRKQQLALLRHHSKRRQFNGQMEVARGGVYNTARVSCHEIGHATCLWYQQHAGAFVQVTIVPRPGHYDGLTTSSWKRQMSRAEMRACLVMQLGGRAAEEVLFGHSIGHAGDEEDWRKMAIMVEAKAGQSEQRSEWAKDGRI
uniref:Peptidase M41 domain-containing protein n=1 Tax=Globodera rostochiensis TaxID=31243 RepID=A0A914I8I1_GLORO